MSLQPPPIQQEVLDEAGIPTLPWTLFFNQSFTGDVGNVWTPTFSGLGSTGAPTITGRYYKLGQELTYFHIHIIPATDTTSTAGTTYCDNFPLSVSRQGVCAAVGGVVGVGIGIIQETGRIYVPAWTAVTVPVTIVGLAEAR